MGTGLPQVNVEQEILKGYFDGEERRGFDFAYQYPGMNKVLQAAGRVIRTAGDRGRDRPAGRAVSLREQPQPLPQGVGGRPGGESENGGGDGERVFGRRQMNIKISAASP